MRGELLVRLNTDTSPIANKYREGKLQRTLKREFKGRETAWKKTDGAAILLLEFRLGESGQVWVTSTALSSSSRSTRFRHGANGTVEPCFGGGTCMLFCSYVGTCECCWLVACLVCLMEWPQGYEVRYVNDRENSSAAITAVTHQTRLETRTKESSMCASLRVVNPEAQ